MFQLLTGKNEIRIQGGTDSVFIYNGEGQGGVAAARSCSLGITGVVERVVKTHPDPVILHGVNITTSSFVDDTMSCDKTAVGARISGNIMTAALDELSLKAHDQKTVQICCGEQTAVEKLEDDLKKTPTEVQSWSVNVGTKEKYLGVMITRGGTKDIIQANINEKRKKIMPVLQTIKKLLEDPKILRIGRLKAACPMLQGQVVPILLYGVECWLGMEEEHYQQMETIFKRAICMLLSLPKTTPYEALLHETGQYPMKQWIHMAKVKYMNRKLHMKQHGRLYCVLRHEVIHGIKNGFVGEADGICRFYNLPDVSTCPIRPEAITRACQEAARKRIWLEVLKKRKIPMIPNTQKVRHEHYEFDPMRSKLITSLNCGALVMKKINPQCIPRKMMKDDLDRSCLWPGCEGLDDLDHVKVCQHYSTRYVDNKMNSNVENTANFLFDLDLERQKQFGFSLVITGSWK